MKSWEELSYIVEFINKMYPEHQAQITNYNTKTSIREWISTKPITDFTDTKLI